MLDQREPIALSHLARQRAGELRRVLRNAARAVGAEPVVDGDVHDELRVTSDA